MALSGLLNLGRDAILAQSYGLTVTGQNVANVNTPGYVRREVLLQVQSGGPIGSVHALGIRRIRDQFLDARFYEATGFSNAASTRDQALAVTEAAFDDNAGGGLAASLSAMLQSFAVLSANPSDTSTRAAVLDKADRFAASVRMIAGSLSTQRQDLLSQAQGTAGQINELLSNIASLDRQIAQQGAVGNETADLRDQQDGLVATLSELTDVHAFTDGSGRLVVMSAGTTLVEGGQASSVEVATATDGSLKVSVKHPGGGATDVTQQVRGGRLGGIRQARDQDLTAIGTRLDQLVYDIATAVNTQHAAGFGLDGVSGRNLFQVTAPPGSAASLALDPDLDGHPERLAASETLVGVPGDAGNAAKLAALASKAIAGGGTRTAAQAYSDLVGDVGLRKAAAEQEAETRSAMQSQVRTMRESESGVSMDEEMISLTKYQRAYEAAAKLIKTADELLAGLMQSLG